jgi:hypothetical protein
MKKFRLLTILLLLSASVWSQNFRLGFQASPHVSWMNSTRGDILNHETKPGVKYGLEADFFIAGYPRYIINSGLFVSNHSFSARDNLDTPFFINKAAFDTLVTLHYRMNYIDVPLNIKLRSEQFYRMTFYGQFGLSNLFNLSASVQSSDLQLAGDAVNSGFNRAIKFYNLSMLMGGGMEYDVGGSIAINIGVQYCNGLTDVTSLNGIDEKTILNSLRLVLGVMF